MKVAKLKNLFTDPELQNALLNGRKKVSEKDLAHRLLESAKRKKLTRIYLKALDENIRMQNSHKICVRLKKRFHEEQKARIAGTVEKIDFAKFPEGDLSL